MAMRWTFEDFKRHFSEVATFPIIPPDVTGGPGQSWSRPLHRHARGWLAPFRAPVEGSHGGLGGIRLLRHNRAATKRSYGPMGNYVHPQFQRAPNALRHWIYDDAKSKYEPPAWRHTRPCKPRSTSIRPANKT